MTKQVYSSGDKIIRTVHEIDNGTVILENDGKNKLKLSIQIVDAYRFQREFNFWYNHDKLKWLYVVYQHPSRRFEGEVSLKIGQEFLDRFLYILNDFPNLLFNKSNENSSRHEGFVILMEKLFSGMPLNKKLI